MQAYVKRFVSYHLNREKLISTVFIIFLITVACLLYWFSLKRTQATLDDEFLHREQVIVRSGSLSISQFMGTLGKNVSNLAEDMSEDQSDGQSQSELQDNLSRFMNSWGGTPVAAVFFADKNGKVIFDENRDGIPAVGGSAADKATYIWAKTANAGEYLIGDPLVGTIGYSKGKYIIPVASPVIC